MKERPDCEYCGWGKQLRIQHAYGERREIGVEKPINEEIEMRVDSADDWETGFIGIDYNGDGFYIDINYCPMCGRQFSPSKTNSSVTAKDGGEV